MTALFEVPALRPRSGRRSVRDRHGRRRGPARRPRVVVRAARTCQRPSRREITGAAGLAALVEEASPLDGEEVRRCRFEVHRLQRKTGGAGRRRRLAKRLLRGGARRHGATAGRRQRRAGEERESEAERHLCVRPAQEAAEDGAELGPLGSDPLGALCLFESLVEPAVEDDEDSDLPEVDVALPPQPRNVWRNGRIAGLGGTGERGAARRRKDVKRGVLDDCVDLYQRLACRRELRELRNVAVARPRRRALQVLQTHAQRAHALVRRRRELLGRFVRHFRHRRPKVVDPPSARRRLWQMAGWRRRARVARICGDRDARIGAAVKCVVI
mmetsp:Transcript_19646/g.69819  ORF Transcript_19646/g.69819 Transcript_19646/m.69819 type:complete len:328 (-) Transcript_19646:839-1822(-)